MEPCGLGFFFLGFFGWCLAMYHKPSPWYCVEFLVGVMIGGCLL